MAAVQRYEVTAAFAYTVIGSETGYLHRRIVDPASGACMDDPTAGPLQVGRFHQTEPACTADEALTVVTPNPCALTLEEPVVANSQAETRTANGIRFRNLGVTFDFADVTLALPEVDGATYSPVSEGYWFTMELASGFTPLSMILTAAYVNRVVAAPDGSLSIVDSGNQTGSKGQIIRFTNSSTPIDDRLY